MWDNGRDVLADFPPDLAPRDGVTATRESAEGPESFPLDTFCTGAHDSVPDQRGVLSKNCTTAYDRLHFATEVGERSGVPFTAADDFRRLQKTR